jgi:hypothetical protein
MNFLLMLFLLLPAAFAQNATVTLFREDQTQTKLYNPDDMARVDSSWNIYMDGRKLATLRRGRMATFSIPAGHHQFKTDKSAEMELDSAPKSHAFIRPLLNIHSPKSEPPVRLVAVDCQEFTLRAEKVEPMDVKDVFTDNQVNKTASFIQACTGR